MVLMIEDHGFILLSTAASANTFGLPGYLLSWHTWEARQQKLAAATQHREHGWPVKHCVIALRYC